MCACGLQEVWANQSTAKNKTAGSEKSAPCATQCSGVIPRVRHTLCVSRHQLCVVRSAVIIRKQLCFSVARFHVDSNMAAGGDRLILGHSLPLMGGLKFLHVVGCCFSPPFFFSQVGGRIVQQLTAFSRNFKYWRLLLTRQRSSIW